MPPLAQAIEYYTYDDYKKLQGNEYIKEGDFSLETYTFDDLKCNASIDFEAVFEKFRK